MKRIVSLLLVSVLFMTCLPLLTAADSETARPEVTDEMLEEGYLDAWFDDAVIIGDSLTAGLSGYVSEERYLKRPCLGQMQLAYSSALTLKKAHDAELGLRPGEIKYRTEYMTASRVISDSGAKKAFILLGVSDVRWYTPEELVNAYAEFLTAIREQHPDTVLIAISITPMLKDYAASVSVTADMSIRANVLLKQYCEENGFYYLELADSLRDDDDFLIYDLSASDYRFHLNKKGKKIWVACMRSFVRDLYNQGLYTPAGEV